MEDKFNEKRERAELQANTPQGKRNKEKKREGGKRRGEEAGYVGRGRQGRGSGSEGRKEKKRIVHSTADSGQLHTHTGSLWCGSWRGIIGRGITGRVIMGRDKDEDGGNYLQAAERRRRGQSKKWEGQAEATKGGGRRRMGQGRRRDVDGEIEEGTSYGKGQDQLEFKLSDGRAYRKREGRGGTVGHVDDDMG